MRTAGKKYIRKKGNRKARPTGSEVQAAPTKQEQKLKAKEHIGLMARGIQTMLRLTSENHLKLSDLADGKANILISVNAIIISVILSVLVRKLEVEPHLTIPTLLFLLSSISTIVVAILATQPKVRPGQFYPRRHYPERNESPVFWQLS